MRERRLGGLDREAAWGKLKKKETCTQCNADPEYPVSG